LTDPSRLSIGGLTFMIMTITNLTWPIMAIGWVATLVQRGSAAMARYDEILKLPVEETSDKKTDIDFRKGSIRFENVSYTYPDTKIEALKNLNFEIPLGERWLIIGKTGSGKSTLAELLLKFYQDYRGTIAINGQELRQIPTDQLREAISYIPQDVFLFSDTVANNIAFSDNHLDPSSIVAAAKNAQIASEIDRFQHGYETVVGERGITLSGGQKQRISIARALIKPAPIYVFDDCLSAVDVETEKNLIAAIDAQAGQHTMIMITHRIFNQLRFDNVLVLSNGSILEMGNHEDLIQANGYYAQLYRRQELMKEQKAATS
jgi:ATP-binding cassette subfamily B multidrug efflux pump